MTTILPNPSPTLIEPSMNLADWAGVLGFFIAAFLAYVRIRETWFLRPAYESGFLWIYGGAAAGPHLEFTVVNTGHAPGVINALLFQTDAEGKPVAPSGYAPNQFHSALPLQLAPGQVSARLRLGVDESQHYRNGKGRVVVTGPKSFLKGYTIPEPSS